MYEDPLAKRLMAVFCRHLSHMFELHIHDIASGCALCREIVRSHQGRECSGSMQHKLMVLQVQKQQQDWVYGESK